MTCSPPLLPDYLARSHNLEVIIGVPTDMQVKAVHDVIRAVNSVSNVSALYDSKLSTQLAQYLFTIQMAVYRNTYPLNVFPGESTYTPPSVPLHIPISLEPVVGPPSDEELESAHGAVRTLENLASSPFFDSAFSVKLSQHVFNIQFARYIQDSNRGHLTQKPANPPPPPQKNEISFVNSGQISNVADQQASRGASSVEVDSGVPTTSQALSSQVAPEPTSIEDPDDKLDQLRAVQKETNRLLSGNEELLKDIRRTLARTYLAVHRGSSTYSDITINERGELPSMYGLPDVFASGSSNKLDRSLTEQDLVGYLKFYNVGSELIEEGTQNLNPGKKADAEKALAYYLYYGRPPASQTV